MTLTKIALGVFLAVLCLGQALPAQNPGIARRKDPPPVAIEALPAEITHGPWVTHMTPVSATIGFTTTVDCGGGVAYREKGAKDWQEKWHCVNGQVDKLQVQHPVHLTGLKPDTEYEYKVLVFRPLVKLDVRSKEARVRRVAAFEDKAWHFRTYSDKTQTFSFCMTADLQFSAIDKKLALQRCHKIKMKDSRFFVLLGDCDDNYDDFDKAYMTDIVDVMTTLGGTCRPTVYVRGNHEWRGCESPLWSRTFTCPDTRAGYYSFTCGEAFFLILDTGEDQAAPKFSFHYTGINAELETYMDEQGRWLDGVVASDAFRKARYRIVLGHGAVYSHPERFMRNSVLRIVKGHFRADAPEERIHLWMSGHTHRYERTIPGKDEVYWIDKPGWKVFRGAEYPFPVVTTSGPARHAHQYTLLNVDVTSEKLAVTAWSRDGKLLDAVDILPNGACIDKNDGKMEAKPMPDNYLK